MGLAGACALSAAVAWQAARLACDEGFRREASGVVSRVAGVASRSARALLSASATRLKPPLAGTGTLSALSRRRASSKRRGACLDELPELIDVVVLGLSAGISFDAALGIYCERYDTMLSALLNDAMRSWQLGFKSRGQALSELARDLDVDAFTSFVDTVEESLQFGAPLARVLVEQGDAVNQRRTSEIEERIEKAPVKMIVPIATMVLPAMLLAILGPLFASFTTIG